MTPVYCTSIGHLGPLEHYFPICREQNEETKHRPLLLVSLRCSELSSMNVCQNDVCIFSELDFWLSSTYGWASFRNHVWWEKKVVHPKLCCLCRCPLPLHKTLFRLSGWASLSLSSAFKTDFARCYYGVRFRGVPRGRIWELHKFYLDEILSANKLRFCFANNS